MQQQLKEQRFNELRVAFRQDAYIFAKGCCLVFAVCSLFTHTRAHTHAIQLLAMCHTEVDKRVLRQLLKTARPTNSGSALPLGVAARVALALQVLVVCAVCGVRCAVCGVLYAVCCVRCAVCCVLCAVCCVLCAVCCVLALIACRRASQNEYAAACQTCNVVAKTSALYTRLAPQAAKKCALRLVVVCSSV